MALINEQLGEHSAEKISAGQVVKGMILNGLGLVSSPLYLFSRFFEGKATEHLLGKGIKAEYLNDDRLGRVLDSLYQTGLNQVFVSIVLEVAKKYEIEVGTVHLDSSSLTPAYQVRGTVSLFEEKIKPIRDSAGRFIIATNVLDEGILTAEAMLSKYKGQQAVER